MKEFEEWGRMKFENNRNALVMGDEKNQEKTLYCLLTLTFYFFPRGVILFKGTMHIHLNH